MKVLIVGPQARPGTLAACLAAGAMGPSFEPLTPEQLALYAKAEENARAMVQQMLDALKEIGKRLLECCRKALADMGAWWDKHGAKWVRWQREQTIYQQANQTRCAARQYQRELEQRQQTMWHQQKRGMA